MLSCVGDWPGAAACNGETVEADGPQVRDDHTRPVLVDARHQRLEPPGCDLCVAIKEENDWELGLFCTTVPCTDDA